MSEIDDLLTDQEKEICTALNMNPIDYIKNKMAVHEFEMQNLKNLLNIPKDIPNQVKLTADERKFIKNYNIDEYKWAKVKNNCLRIGIHLDFIGSE